MGLWLGNNPVSLAYLGSTPVSDYSFIPVVTNGAILYLDAGNKTSYPGSGSIWTDLSGNNNSASLANTPTFNSANQGYLEFNGTNQSGTTANTTTLTQGTFLMWIYSTQNQDQYDGLLFARDTQATGMNFQSSNQLAYHWNSGEFTWNSGLNVPNNEWCMVAVSVSPTNAVAYLCKQSGTTTATNTATHGTAANNKFVIANDTFGSRYFTGNIGIVLAYNRALSAGEISQNFNATKLRYGIT